MISVSFVAGLLFLAAAALAAAPASPTGLTATSTEPTKAALSWAAPADATAVGYQIFKNGLQIATNTPATSTSFLAEGLVPATVYEFGVAAFNAGGEVSTLATASVTTLSDTSAPTVPTGLAAVPATLSQINLSWSSSTDNVAVTGYKVYRNDVQVATTTLTSYQDTGLLATTTYNYNVAAFDAAGNVSALSATSSATTQADTSAPTMPTGLSGASVLTSQINLSWTASTDNAAVTGYRIYRNNVQIATSPTNSYSDTGLTAATTYAYNVSAFDAAGNVSALSATTSLTTLAENPPTASGTIAVKIQINPGERQPRLINLNSNEKIKVVVYGAADLNVHNIMPRTVRFAGAKAVGWRLRDVNRDGILDRVFDFRGRQMTDLYNATGTVEALLIGKVKNGSSISGKAVVRVKNPRKDREESNRIKREKEQAEREWREKLREGRDKIQELKRETQKKVEELKKEVKKKVEEIKKSIPKKNGNKK